MTPQSSESSFIQEPSVARRIWTFVRILNVRLRFVFLMVLVGLTVGYWETITNYYDRWRRPATVPDLVGIQNVEYYCPMHPSVVRGELGNCPICGMPLVKRAKSERGPLPDGVTAQVQLTPQKLALGRIATAPVEYRLLAREIRTVGLLDYDETRRAFIAARIKGRIDKLLVNYVGQHVEQGDPLAWIYSPALFTAQEELLVATRRLTERSGAEGFAATTGQSLLDAARQKLILWGITSEQIEQIIQRGAPETHLTIYSPMSGIVTEKGVLEGHYVNEGDDLYTIADLSRVWMQTQIFEDQVAGVKVGTTVEITTTAYPDEFFAGRITFIAYTVDPATRTVAARVEFDNADHRLKPGMYANAVIRLPVGEIAVLDVSPESAPAPAEPATQAVGADGMVSAYLALSSAYARDALDDASAKQLQRDARRLAERGPTDVRAQAEQIAKQADALPGKTLEQQRTAFKPLSGGFIEWLRAHPPAGRTLYIAHCPMVDADWVQESNQIANPYYGSGMLRCGSVTETVQHQAGDERWATGYFCPVYPERLFDRPELCPIDRFPLRFVRAERVLSIPQSAVIDSGTRKIVYRESAPGVFDMLEVQLGRRAGEFYPLLSGLKFGDRVATSGAFLVDAESRLNPAASAQYFGASGGPQSAGQHEHQH